MSKDEIEIEQPEKKVNVLKEFFTLIDKTKKDKD